MSQKLGLLSCLAYSVGGMIGSGIFVAPTSVLLHAGSSGLSLCLWIGGALVSATGALIYVELGTCIPETGGGFAYQMRAKWKWLAFPFFWLGALFTCPMILAIQTTGLSQLIIQTLKQGFELEDTVALVIQWSCGLLALAFILTINMFSLEKYAAKFQVVFTAIKLLIVAAIIIIGIEHIIAKGPSKALAHPFENSTNKPFEVVLGLYASLFSYTGWEALNTALGEVENPKLILPIASIGGIFIVCIISILLNVAYFSVIDTKEFLKTSAVAALFCERTMGHVSVIIPLLIALLMLANLNTTLFATSRYMFAGAAKRALPRTFACQHPTYLTPRVSVAAQIILAAALSFIGNLDQLISYMSYAELMDRLSVQFALIYMRYKKFEIPENAYQTPIFVPFIYMTFCFVLLAIPLYQNYKIAIFALATIVVSFVVYIAVYWLNCWSDYFYKIDDILCDLSCRLFNVVDKIGEDPKNLNSIENNTSTVIETQ